MIFFKKDGFSLIFKVAYLVKDEQCLFAEDLKLTSGNCLLCMLMCVQSEENEDVIEAGFSVLDNL